MEFVELYLLDYPLLDDPPHNNHRSFRKKRILIVVGSISLTILILAFTLSMIMIYTTKQQQKRLPMNEFIASIKSTTTMGISTTPFSTTNNELESSSKQSFFVFCLLNMERNSLVYMISIRRSWFKNLF
jgi:uncharacterized membrane protein